ncbi:hypothetical protein FISHEDRAFT_68769 [Fistulina hepatica ATCC 64428]|uniref:Uncharacterized protein n=1 Tax=Fistulina hepatica ATCC 64428 TaxID=1128425 RepID=A0A0D7AP62_9AGAR|nr:hypothetical protein FISHEDRAFT_68769 [Fistulina hepatica ATCC 64428]
MLAEQLPLHVCVYGYVDEIEAEQYVEFKFPFGDTVLAFKVSSAFEKLRSEGTKSPGTAEVPKGRITFAPDYPVRETQVEDLDVPVIRVVFSLGGRRPALRVVPQSSEPGEFTSYDIWASGLSKEVFCACKDYLSPWRDLLAVSSGWKDLYTEKDSLQRELQMQTTPMAGKDDAFWQWIGPAWKTH